MRFQGFFFFFFSLKRGENEGLLPYFPAGKLPQQAEAEALEN